MESVDTVRGRTDAGFVSYYYDPNQSIMERLQSYRSALEMAASYLGTVPWREVEMVLVGRLPKQWVTTMPTFVFHVPDPQTRLMPSYGLFTELGVLGYWRILFDPALGEDAYVFNSTAQVRISVSNYFGP